MMEKYYAKVVFDSDHSEKPKIEEGLSNYFAVPQDEIQIDQGDHIYLSGPEGDLSGVKVTGRNSSYSFYSSSLSNGISIELLSESLSVRDGLIRSVCKDFTKQKKKFEVISAKW